MNLERFKAGDDIAQMLPIEEDKNVELFFVNENNVCDISGYDDHTRSGRYMSPIYGVFENGQCHVFVGERPHKDENGKWVTNNNVPNFISNWLPGISFLEKDKENPHFIMIETIEQNEEEKSRRLDYEESLRNKINALENQTYSQLFGRIWEKFKVNMKHFFGTYRIFKGDFKFAYIHYFGFLKKFNLVYIGYYSDYNGCDIFLDLATENRLYRLYVKRNFIWKLEALNWENNIFNSEI